MDRSRRNLRHELNKAFYRALEMPTVGPNSYGQLFEQARNVCLLKLPNDPAISYQGVDPIKSAFINAAAKVYFAMSQGDVAFAFYNSFYTEPAYDRRLNPAQASVVNFYHARLRIAGKKYKLATTFEEAFKEGVISVGSIEVLSHSGRRSLIDIPDLTQQALKIYEDNNQTPPENTVFLGCVTDHAIIKSITDMGIPLATREEVLARVLEQRYGPHQKPEV